MTRRPWIWPLATFLGCCFLAILALYCFSSFYRAPRPWSEPLAARSFGTDWNGLQAPVATSRTLTIRPVAGLAPSDSGQLILWRIGSIDPRFGVGAEQAREACNEAIGIWEAAAHRKLFQYDQNGFPIDFLYTDVQSLLDHRASDKAALSNSEAQLEAARTTYDSARQAHESAETELTNEEQQLDQRLSSYNSRVQNLNGAGGAGQDTAAELDGEKASIESDRNVLQIEEQKLNESTSNVNELGDEYNSRLTAYDQAVSDYNRTYGHVQLKLGECWRSSQRVWWIRVYGFVDIPDLKMTLAHELGHALGLGHVAGSASIMSAVGDGDPEGLRLTREDRAALKQLLAERS